MRTVARFIEYLAKTFALLGGAVLSVLIIMTCLSIAGRSLNGLLHHDWLQSTVPDPANWLLDLGIGPINGDFEIVEAGIAFAVFAFIPLCQWTFSHASVDIFTSRLPAAANRLLSTLIDIVFAIILVVIAFQLTRGLISKFNSGQTTLLLQFPVWWSYTACALAAWAAALTGMFIAAARVLNWFGSENLLADERFKGNDANADAVISG